MATTDKPKARQSQLVTTYGVGSLFPAGDQSFMICGTDEWDEKWSPTVEEPRLARSLGVHAFRAPSTGKRSGDVPVVRFPVVHYCPECRRLDPFWKFDAKTMRCDDCERDLTPSRFVACCERGHIEDFPYYQWLHKDLVTSGGKHVLKLKTKGASSSLSDILVDCSCGASRDLGGAFSRNSLVGIRGCGGQRPWLPGTPDDDCDKPLRVLQRGSSNVWFSEMRSSISIPPWTSPEARFVTEHWAVLEHLTVESLALALPAMVASHAGVSAEGVLGLVKERKGFDAEEAPTDGQLRKQEYDALVATNEGGPQDTFRCVDVEVDQDIMPFVAQVAKVSRLREVRALYGFSRVTPSATEKVSPRTARLSAAHKNWLPAVEVLGEGVFVRLREDVVAGWEKTAFAASRQALIAESLRMKAESSGQPVQETPAVRYLALHSLAHAFLQELSLEAGYPVGSLRERVYAEKNQAGILIYTASSDAAGSLGGLAALSAPERLTPTLEHAVGRAGWCSNDPVCADSGPTGSDGLNIAACHACQLLPETSCESRNIYLDRVSLVGPIDAPERGFTAVLRSGLTDSSLTDHDEEWPG